MSTTIQHCGAKFGDLLHVALLGRTVLFIYLGTTEIEHPELRMWRDMHYGLCVISDTDIVSVGAIDMYNDCYVDIIARMDEAL